MKGLRKKHNKQQQQTIKKIRQGENKQQKIRFKLKHGHNCTKHYWIKQSD